MSINTVRIGWVDIAKCFGIFLVVLGHLPIPATLKIVIYSFHMPFFFFISGYLFNIKKHSAFIDFLRHRTKQLLVPYFFFSIITYIFWLFIGRKFGADTLENIPVYKPLLGIFYGTDTDNYLIHCGALWFLPCLFIVEIIYCLLYKLINKYLQFLVYAVIGYVNWKFHDVALPFSFNAALSALFFYAVGNILKEPIERHLSIKPLYLFLSGFAALCIWIRLSIFNGRVDMSSGTYNYYLLFLIVALMGIYFNILFSFFVFLFRGSRLIFDFVAKNTIIILAFHFIAGSVIKAALFFIFKVPLDIFEGEIILNIIFAVLTFLFLVPVIFILNKYFPFLIGKERKKMEF